jgi:hypothetical protein
MRSASDCGACGGVTTSSCSFGADYVGTRAAVQLFRPAISSLPYLSRIDAME